MAMNVASRSSSSLAPACFAPAKRFLLQGSHPAISAPAYASRVSVFLSSEPGVNRSPANSWRTLAPSIRTSQWANEERSGVLAGSYRARRPGAGLHPLQAAPHLERDQPDHGQEDEHRRHGGDRRIDLVADVLPHLERQRLHVHAADEHGDDDLVEGVD